MRQYAGKSTLFDWSWFVRTLAKAHNGTFKDDRVLFKPMVDSEDGLNATLTMFKDPLLEHVAKQDFTTLVSNLEDVVVRLESLLGL